MCIRLSAWISCYASCVFLLPHPLVAQDPGSASIASGKTLFTREWEPVDADNPMAADGLGPMFNANSCVACHNLGGIGGAGDNSTNVQVMSVLKN